MFVKVNNMYTLIKTIEHQAVSSFPVHPKEQGTPLLVEFLRPCQQDIC